jgi:LuxR family maltose regulon positive regulatory protein
MAVPDLALAAHVAEQYGIHMCGSGRVVTYLGWVQQIPDDVIYARPYLCAACGWAYVLSRQLEAAERYVRAGRAVLAGFKGLHTAPDGRSITHEEMQGHLAGILAYAAQIQGDRAGVIAYSQQALAQLPAGAFAVRSAVALNLGFSHLECGETEAAHVALVEAFEAAQKSGANAYVASSALFLRGQILASQGKLREATKIYQQIIELGTVENSHTPTVGMGHRGFGLVHYERNELAAAAHHFEKSLAFSRQVGNHEYIVNTYLFMARLAISTGALAQAEERLGQVDELIQTHQLARYHLPFTMIQGELYLAQGDAHTAALHAKVYSSQVAELKVTDVTTGIWGGWLSGVLLLPRVLLAQDKPDEALDLLDQVATRAEARQYGSILIEARVLQALAWRRKENDEQALEYLEHALTLAAPEDFVRPFVVAGEPLVELLRQAAAQGTEREYVSKLLAALASPPGPAEQPLIEPLSERELQVLRLIADGLSNPQIADQLCISVNTVRFHTKNIYGKLGVNSRTQAIAQASALNLL